MRVVYDSLQGPIKCKVIQEIDAELVRVKPLGLPGGPFGGIGTPAELAARQQDFIASKSACWANVQPLGRYNQRFMFTGRPVWQIKG